MQTKLLYLRHRHIETHSGPDWPKLRLEQAYVQCTRNDKKKSGSHRFQSLIFINDLLVVGLNLSISQPLNLSTSNSHPQTLTLSPSNSQPLKLSTSHPLTLSPSQPLSLSVSQSLNLQDTVLMWQHPEGVVTALSCTKWDALKQTTHCLPRQIPARDGLVLRDLLKEQRGTQN